MAVTGQRLNQRATHKFPPPATKGSAGIDLINTMDMQATLPGEVLLMPSQLTGPLPEGTVGIILPRSSAHKHAIMVIPGVIDSDYTGIIYVQMWGQLPLTLTKGDTWAQLLILPFIPPNQPSSAIRRGGFGST
uniref:dUTPase-like domain-containing protein n=1 Tax=Chelydra serpentina TaxID=8475 RepID=A0A8C3SPL0_CHESE